MRLLNHELGYKEIPFSTILEDTHFVSGCDSWVDYLGLMADQTLSSQYVAMIHSPTDY